MRNQLVKDLEAMVNWDDLNPTQDWETMTMTFELDDENIRRIAKGLTELGYVKVVRCGECKHWHPNGNCDGIRIGYCTQGDEPLGWEVPLYSEYHYCSEGEPKEAGE